jgi:ferredoxin, 2Fe-2S
MSEPTRVRVTLVAASGKEHVLELKEGDNLMQEATRNNVPGIVATCGGAQVCATCQVYVREAWFGRLDPPSDLEKDMLEMAVERRDCSRLSCCIQLRAELAGMIVDIPVSQF